MDLLLVDGINNYILIKDINKFISNNSHVVKSCRNCLNSFYSEEKYKFHIEYCKNRKPKKLLPSFKKYLQFENLKNCILHNWIIRSDFECIIDANTKEHRVISGGCLLECKNEKYSKNIQTFYNFEECTKSLYNELKYIEEIEESHLQNPIDYSNFDQNEFNNTVKCKYCDNEFNHNCNNRCIILNEIVDKEKFKYILDNNNFDQEVNNLAKNYYDSLDDIGRKRIIYKQKYNCKNAYYGVGSCLSYLKKEIRNSIMPTNNRINNYLKLLEKKIIEIQNYFYLKDKRYFEKGFNFKGKNLSRIILDIENQILQIMINYFLSKKVNIFTLEYDRLKIYSDSKSKHFSINESEKIILEKTKINMKLSFKPINDSFPEFGIRVSTDNIKNENIIENKIKVVHHDPLKISRL